MKQRLMTIRQASEFLCVSESFLYHKVAAGALEHVKLGRAVRFDLRALERYIEENLHGEKDWSEVMDRKRRKK